MYVMIVQGSAGGLAWHFGVSVPTRSRINNFYEDYNKKNPVRASVYKTEEGIAMIGNVDLNDPEVKKILDSIDTKVDE